eukprot:GHVQ01002088.1.p1 GENE.GHVQ01002088.1~~GHVQ01002088.1.p1  ORF type:complete len:123 (+),score=16.70 GHVQ01002088.1:366-734(+)
MTLPSPSGDKEEVAGVGRVRHMVLIKFNPSANCALIEECIQRGELLASEITDIDFVLKIRPTFTTARAKGYTHVIYSHFKHKDDLEAYSKHPLHMEYLNKYKPHFEDVCAVDIDLDETACCL